MVLIFALGIGMWRLPNRMPLAATCSGALSAACHPRMLEGVMHHEEQVHWGVETTDGDEEEDENRIQRCTFTSLEAYYPIADRFYA